MIIFIHGPDTFRSRHYLRGAVEKFKETRDKAGYNVVVLDGQKAESSRIFSELTAAPFLAEKRLVVIENILSRKDEKALAELTEWVKETKIPESTVAIFWQGEALGKSKVVKSLAALLSKEKFAQEFKELPPKEREAWLAKEVSLRGGKIAPGALNFLAANTQDLWSLNSQIDQLIAYSNGAEINIEAVKIFSETKLDDNIFSLVDAVVAGRQKEALNLLEYQRRLGEEDGKIFGLIIWQMRIILEIADLAAREKNLGSDELAKLSGLHPYVVKKNFALARRAPLLAFKKTYHELLDIDRQTKTGGAPQSLLLDKFIAGSFGHAA